MPWRVGLDEAGYGPNLGPLVLAATACRVPADAPDCLWTLLKAGVCKHGRKAKDRLVVDDSKKVYAAGKGFESLEAAVFAVERQCGLASATAGGLIQAIGLGQSLFDLKGEPWFDPDEAVPAACPEEKAETLAQASRARGVEWARPQAVVMPAPRFNRLLAEWKLKSGVLATGVIALLRSALDLPGYDPILIAVDRLGGRQFYAPLLNEAFAGGWVRVIRESPERCEYAIDGLGREIRVQFEPKADGAHLNVALASMTAKYLRELCMAQFNRYWARRVPGIVPTAGYPVDAARYFAAIQPTMLADGIENRLVWREK